MARKTTVELVDDLTGEKADETVTFGLDGVSYEIDLSDKNAAELREKLTEWAGKARRIGGRKQRGTGSVGGTSDAAQVRVWARENGYEVPERGRIPSEIREAYEAGTPASTSKQDDKPKQDEKPAAEQKQAPKAKADNKTEQKADDKASA